MSVEDVRALPWWQQRLYDEGLLAEFEGVRPPPDDGVDVVESDREPEARSTTFG